MPSARLIAGFAFAVAAAVPLALTIAHAEGPARTAHAGLAEPLAAVRLVHENRPEPSHAAEAPAGGACREGMALVDGDSCPRLEQRCLRWLDPPGKYHEYRCAEYARDPRCLAARVHQRFCIDRHERTEPATGLPLNGQSWSDAKRACEADGARVCKDSEWTFACEGEEMRPYPYGWRREAERCNADKADLLLPGQPSRLRDEREPAGAHPACVSAFGVFDMAGNVAEWVTVDGFDEGSVVVQKGNWWQPGKHACRDAQGGHDRFYRGTETGFRCCAAAADR
jgi:sulfatase modifying factor 1